MVNFTVSEGYDCKHPWVYKDSKDGMIAADVLTYVDDGRPIGLAKEILWKVSRRWVSMCACLGIKDASRKVNPL